MREEIFISVDIEADGPTPGDYSMVSIGAISLNGPRKGHTFYRELKPITDRWDPVAMQVNKLDREKLKKHGYEPAHAMKDFADFLKEITPENAKPIFVSFNATFDWMFVCWYFHHFLGKNPFGISGLDLKALYMGLTRRKYWFETAKKNMDKKYLSSRKHTHNALEDAIEQGEIFEKLMEKIKRAP